MAQPAVAESEWVQWDPDDGGNGHWYKPVATDEPISWLEAQEAAHEAGGFLASVTSEEENEFVFSLIDSEDYWFVSQFDNAEGPWIGGIRTRLTDDLQLDWGWVSGEPFEYESWGEELPGPPAPANHTAIHYWGRGGDRKPIWNDNTLHVPLRSYVIETTRDPHAAAEVDPDVEIGWVYLAYPETGGAPPHKSALERELFRQAMLLTAREEFGLQTRDATLGEPRPTNAKHGLVLQVRGHAGPARVEMWILDEQGQHVERFFAQIQRLPDANINDWRELLETVDRWTRNELVTTFERLGLERQAVESQPQGGLSDAIERQIRVPNAFSQHEAVRRTHRLIREEGESPERLAALARAYANLGQFVRYHVNATEQVFYARALLYSHRLLERHGDEPAHRWARAHVYAMSGLDYLAIEDFEHADEEADGEQPPAWAQLVDHYVHHRPKKLEAVAARGGDEAAMAAYWRFLLAEHQHSGETTIRYAEALLERAPHAKRAVAAMIQSGGVSNRHRSTLMGPEMLQATVPAALDRVEGLSEEVRQLGRQMSSEDWPTASTARLVEALRNESDPEHCADEPSWAVLGHLIEETNFYQVISRAYFRKFTWSVDASEFVRQAQPSIEGHRYAPFLESMTMDPQSQGAQINALIEDVEFGDLNLSGQILFNRAWWDTGDYSAWQATLRAADATRHDLVQQLHEHGDRYGDQWSRDRMRPLRKVSPYAVQGVAYQIRLEWDQIEDELDDLQERLGDDPTFLSALVNQYLQRGRDDDAMPLLERLIEETRQREYYESLAELYLNDEQEDRWLQTLQRYLAEGVDEGLGRSNVRATIAGHFWTTDRPERAIPYGEQAAQSGSARGLLAAGRAHEAAGNWAESEQWFRRVATRYGSSAHQWYFWCRRTGQGDLEAAREHFEQHMADQDQRGGDLWRADMERRATYYLLEGDREAALGYFRRLFYRWPDPWSGILKALTAHEQQDYATRNRMIRRVLELEGRGGLNNPEDRPFMIEALKQIEPAITNGSDVDIDLSDVEARMEQLPERRQAATYFMIANLFVMAEDDEQVETYLRRAARPYDLSLQTQTLGRQRMREMDIEP